MGKVSRFAGAAVLAGAMALGGAASATQPDSEGPAAGGPYVEDGHKVTICHRTGAEDKYVVITVDVAAIDGEGNSDHDHHEQVGNGPGGDVIPPVAGYNDDGKNWNDNWAPGAEVTEADCLGSPPPPPPSI